MTKTIKKKTRAPATKREEWTKPDKLILLRGWARDGLTDEQIASRIGIKRPTLVSWKAKEPSISEALLKGKEVVDSEVENALLKRALGFKTSNKQTFVTQSDGKTTKRVVITEIEHPPDAAAIIFWLKNRRPDKWRQMAPAFERKTEAEAEKIEKEIEKLELEIAQLKDASLETDEAIVIVDSWADGIAEEVTRAAKAEKADKLEEVKAEKAANEKRDKLAGKHISREPKGVRD